MNKLVKIVAVKENAKTFGTAKNIVLNSGLINSYSTSGGVTSILYSSLGVIKDIDSFECSSISPYPTANVYCEVIAVTVNRIGVRYVDAHSKNLSLSNIIKVEQITSTESDGSIVYTYELNRNGNKEILTYEVTETLTQIMTQNIAITASPKPYKVYTALISQVGTADPTVIELENTLGSVSWDRDNDGEYSAISSGLFTDNKTAIFIGSVGDSDINSPYTSRVYRSNTNTIKIGTFLGNSTHDQVDTVLDQTSIEIRVYD